MRIVSFYAGRECTGTADRSAPLYPPFLSDPQGSAPFSGIFPALLEQLHQGVTLLWGDSYTTMVGRHSRPVRANQSELARDTHTSFLDGCSSFLH